LPAPLFVNAFSSCPGSDRLNWPLCVRLSCHQCILAPHAWCPLVWSFSHFGLWHPVECLPHRPWGPTPFFGYPTMWRPPPHTKSASSMDAYFVLPYSFNSLRKRKG
jgi:hypothetical protein